MASHQDIIAFKARFSALASVKTPDIAAAIDLADGFLDASKWDPSDFLIARLLLAAHLTAMEQQAIANNTIDGTGMSDLFVNTVKFGERTVSFAQRQAFSKLGAGMAPGEEMLLRTQYGELFLQLRFRNVPAVAII